MQVLNLGINGNGEKKKEEAIGVPLRDRPAKVMGATYKMNTPVGSAFITINQDENGDPLEIFINVGKAGSDVAAMAEALGRTISTAFRFRGSLAPKEKAREIAGQLSGIGGRRSVGFGPNKVRSLPDAIGSALSLHYNLNINGYAHDEASLKAASAVMEAVGSAQVESTPTGHPGPTTASAASNGASNGNSHLTNGHTIKEVAEDLPDLIIPTRDEIKDFSFETAEKPGDICPACGASALVYEEGCSKCHACGHSEC
jgi:ribonucleoside-diphosphate reductase alpha chain